MLNTAAIILARSGTKSLLDKDYRPLIELLKKIHEKAFQKGLLIIYTWRKSIKFMPPLSISKEAILLETKVIQQCIQESL